MTNAKTHAQEIAAELGTVAQHGIDTDYDAPCWVAAQTEGGAVVVYDDEPGCQCSTSNHPGRFAIEATI